MPQSLSRVVRYPDRTDTFLYVFEHPTLPRLGFRVRREQVSMRDYYRIKSLLAGTGDDPKEES